jgi:TfoX/Sxy family transcriptional regulator of competence genes
MPYDEGLAQRIRELLEDDPRISEKKMFGGIGFFVNGNMAAGTMRDELMVRVGPGGHDAAIAQPHARAMDFTGRTMRGFVQVAPAGFEDDTDLAAWLARGIAYAEKQEKKTLGAPKAPSRKKAGAKAAAAAAARKPASRAKPGKPGPRRPAPRGARKR